MLRWRGLCCVGGDYVALAGIMLRWRGLCSAHHERKVRHELERMSVENRERVDDVVEYLLREPCEEKELNLASLFLSVSLRVHACEADAGGCDILPMFTKPHLTHFLEVTLHKRTPR